MGSTSFLKNRGCFYLELFSFQFSSRLSDIVYILAAYVWSSLVH